MSLARIVAIRYLHIPTTGHGLIPVQFVHAPAETKVSMILSNSAQFIFTGNVEVESVLARTNINIRKRVGSRFNFW